MCSGIQPGESGGIALDEQTTLKSVAYILESLIASPPIIIKQPYLYLQMLPMIVAYDKYKIINTICT